MIKLDRALLFERGRVDWHTRAHRDVGPGQGRERSYTSDPGLARMSEVNAVALRANEKRGSVDETEPRFRQHMTFEQPVLPRITLRGTPAEAAAPAFAQHWPAFTGFPRKITES